MENKPQNLFEKIDKQGEQVEDISKKLEGISINDLYALAKRTWDYGDFQTAQKYYNHISLLRPLDWEAPLYASLCNFKGYHDMFFWTKAPEQEEKIFVSTIKYIDNLELEHNEKESEMSRCIEIIKNQIAIIKDHYFKYKKDYDNQDSEYIYTLENFLINIYKEIRHIELESIKILTVEIAEQLLDLIVQINKISIDISKEIYVELKNLTTKEFNIDYDTIYENSRKEFDLIEEKLSVEEIKKIKLNGTIYFEYNDKVISKRIFIEKLITGLSLLLISTLGCIFAILNNWYFASLFAFSIFYGFILTFSSLVFKNKINCSSILCFPRVKNRLSSNGDVVREKRFNFLQYIIYLGCAFQWMFGIFMVINLLDSNIYLSHKIIISICAVVSIIIYYIAILRNSIKGHSKYDGTYSYYYEGKFYKL